ncbi:MAG: sensor histidine kinase [Gluconacetobacter diazotrophicus]|nr:sensor histidine kinase [Gluconacetobacter diazotrophicus]
MLLAGLFGGGAIGWRGAADRSSAALPGLAALSVSALASELAKQRVLCRVLAQDPEIGAVLADPSVVRIATVDDKLAALRDATGARVIYLIDRRGTAIAASNWRDPDSFVGSDYRFRDYYRAALRDGGAEEFALGSMSHRPGAYLSRAVPGGVSGAAGVLVVKVEFDDTERDWLHTGNRVLVTDPDGVVLLSSAPQWRFRTVGRLDAARMAAIRRSRQFGAEAALTPLPLVAGSVPGIGRWDRRRFAAVAVPVRTTPWTLHLLVPADAVLAAGSRSGASAGGGAALLLIALGAFALHRADRSAAAASFNRRLRDEVAVRTGELHAANASLRAEMNERQGAENRLAALQSDLAQANRLATLGQVAASVGHEINQPVAAIRAYADNAAVFLDRDRPADARRNLGRIAELTETVGSITAELRGFSRKARGVIGPMPLDEAVNGALLLTAHRLRRHGIVLEDGIGGRALAVRGERVRVQQILVNLIQNAADALGEGGRITLSAEAGAGRVRVVVADTGPGIAPDRLPLLFMPFATGKPAGLGIGLVVSQDLARDMGGTLGGGNGPGGGALFVLDLPAA